MSKYGIKIKNYKVGSIYEYDLGVRDRYHFQNAMFTNSLFLDFLLKNGLKEINGITRDIIGINFEYGSKSYKEMINQTQKKINENIERENQDNINYYTSLLDKIESHKDKYDKKSADELRLKYYKEGINIKYPTYYKDGVLKKIEVIHYIMLYRSTGKAKEGSCIFINKKLYKKAINFLHMGINLPKKNAPIVEISAYSSLICSTIVDTIKINPKNILILKDIDSCFNTNVVSVEIDKNKHCIAKSIQDYTVKNTLFDGQCLVDDKIFPKLKNGIELGAILLRHHMCKMGGVHTYIQKFFKDYFKEDYNNAIIYDMWGNKHYAKDIEVITTDNAMKWIKFDISYDYWCGKVNENNNTFGIVKAPHKSKLGDVQRMSYQMVNALDLDIMPNVVEDSKNYIESMKKDNDIFLQYLKDNKNFSNDYEVLVALCEQNMEFTRSEYFRDRKKKIIDTYISNFRFGKVIQNADNLVIVGSPYAMLLYSVGENVDKDDTFSIENGTIQCYTQRFKNGEYLAEFRSPFNSKNNLGYLHNIYSDNMNKYFNLGEQVIAVNMINTDFQDRNNGSDQDFDVIYCTNQKNIVEYSKYCYINYPTIVNNIPKETKKYDNSLLNYAIIDNNLASSQGAIGESSNMAQLSLTYTYNFEDKKYQDYVCILSVLAQVAIDNAKRKFDVDLVSEIDRIKKDMNIKKIQYPLFWKHAKDKKIKAGKPKFNKEKINKSLQCPMNYLMTVKFQEFKASESTLPMSYFFNKFELDKDRRKCKKVEELIEKYSLCLYNNIKYNNSDELLLRNDFDNIIEDIKKIYISKNYLGLMSWLIDRAFCITYQINNNINTKNNQTDKNKSILLKTLYTINKDNLLKIFSKNM
jgi:hypothetical protein